jgi:hypothetical protein
MSLGIIVDRSGAPVLSKNGTMLAVVSGASQAGGIIATSITFASALLAVAGVTPE